MEKKEVTYKNIVTSFNFVRHCCCSRVNEMPIFVRAGAMLPKYAYAQSSYTEEYFQMLANITIKEVRQFRRK